jgi:carbamoyltransferase
MALWMGFALPESAAGLRQKDNGICLVDEGGVVFAVSEERLSRTKHDNSILHSLEMAKRWAEIDGRPIVSAAFSSCGDFPDLPRTFPLGISSPVRPVPSHHYSHALSAFLTSPFREALILVMDAGGNTLVPGYEHSWWLSHREQTTLWLGSHGSIHLLERYHSKPGDVGYGEWYRAFTHYLGWKSHTLSGNTMAAAGFGDPMWFDGPTLWDDASGTLGGQVLNDPFRPEQMVGEALSRLGVRPVQARHSNGLLTEDHYGLAAYLQRSLETSVDRLIHNALKEYGQPNICLTGGVAQNCVMAGRIAEQVGGEHIFVSAYSGDVGQPIGNALYARRRDMGESPPTPEDVYIGPHWIGVTGELSTAPALSMAIVDEVAQRIADGQIVAICHGRSEFGPRALGHRSVLCDPCNHEAVATVKAKVKKREDFMPLAPVVTEELADEMSIPWSRTMTLASTIPAAFVEEFGEGVHVDGTARLQVATKQSTLGRLLSRFYGRTGRRVLINTSFNRRGQPIVQSRADALEALADLGVDALLLEDVLIDKARAPRFG